MKAQELRIGNLVYLSDKEKVWEILDGHEIDECDDNPFAQPIPITEEWLLKFGFIDLKERCGLDGIYSIIGKQIHINIETKSYCQIDYEGSVCDIVKIEYVHDLQNLFYALNKEELTYGGNK
jgi:hypothetical protein